MSVPSPFFLQLKKTNIEAALTNTAASFRIAQLIDSDSYDGPIFIIRDHFYYNAASKNTEKLPFSVELYKKMATAGLTFGPMVIIRNRFRSSLNVTICWLQRLLDLKRNIPFDSKYPIKIIAAVREWANDAKMFKKTTKSIVTDRQKLPTFRTKKLRKKINAIDFVLSDATLRFDQPFDKILFKAATNTPLSTSLLAVLDQLEVANNHMTALPSHITHITFTPMAAESLQALVSNENQKQEIGIVLTAARVNTASSI